MSSNRIQCTECEWVGTNADTLRAPNPFDETEELHGCPRCKTPDNFDLLCEREGCNKIAGCGTPDGDHYWQTCFAHRPKERT